MTTGTMIIIISAAVVLTALLTFLIVRSILISRFEVERTSLVSRHESEKSSLVSSLERSAHRSDVDNFEQRLSDARSHHEKAVALLKESHDSAVRQLKTSHEAALNQQMETLKSQMTSYTQR